MKWEDIRGHAVRYESGSKLGLLKDLCLNEKDAGIAFLEVTPPKPWLPAEGKLVSEPILVPVDAATLQGSDVIVVDQFSPEAPPDKARGLARLSKLVNAEVYAGRGWRIGRLVAFSLDQDSWSLNRLEIDVYPEYLISSGRHTETLPKGFPPLTRVSVRGDGVELKPADILERSFSIILPIDGGTIEESLTALLMDLGNRTPTIEEQAELVQEAFDRSYENQTRDMG